MNQSPNGNKSNTKKRGRPVVDGEEKMYCFKLRRGRSVEEDQLIERLDQLVARGQRSRFIRRVLTTGDVEPVITREFERESKLVLSALDAMGSLWVEEED